MLPTHIQVVQTEKGSLLPKRSTQYSAGYDIFAPDTLHLEPKQSTSFILPFSFTSPSEQEGYVGMLVVRSSYGIKKKLRIVDKRGRFLKEETFSFDEQPKEVRLFNDSDETLVIPKNEHFLQFLLTKSSDKTVAVSFEKVSEQTAKGYPSLGFKVTESKGVYTLLATAPVTFLPNEQRTLSTGLKASFTKGAWLGATIADAVQDSLLFANATPVIDADYYNNASNEGLLFIGIVNISSQPVIVGKGEAICTFKAHPFYLLANDVASDVERTGGIGSTTNEK